MTYDAPIPLADLAACLADVIDSVDSSVAGHHRKVAALCHTLAQGIGLDAESQSSLALAGAIHDIGALSLSERLGALRFDVEDCSHSEPGYLLLRGFGPFKRLAEVIRWHHVWWCDIANFGLTEEDPIVTESQVLFFSDRLSVLSAVYHEWPDALTCIREIAEENAGTMFSPRIVEAALALPDTHPFWQHVVRPASEFSDLRIKSSAELPWHCLETFAVMVSRLIDFRCSFTASHSSGVAACAVALASVSGMDEAEIRTMRIAGYLHDIGKLAVPKELIEATSQLTAEQFEVIRSHVVHSSAVLWRLGGPPALQTWVSQHHERPNGTGYPCGIGGADLDLGSRIIALADVFVALAEDRPYRAALRREETIAILTVMAERGELDDGLVRTLIGRYDMLDQVRVSAQEVSRHDFDRFRAEVAQAERAA